MIGTQLSKLSLNSCNAQIVTVILGDIQLIFQCRLIGFHGAEFGLEFLDFLLEVVDLSLSFLQSVSHIIELVSNTIRSLLCRPTQLKGTAHNTGQI